MPTYTFYDKKKRKQWTEMMSNAERETLLEQNPHITQQFIQAPNIGDTVRLGMRKPDEGFRDLLRTMKKKHKNLKGTGINTF